MSGEEAQNGDKAFYYEPLDAEEIHEEDAYAAVFLNVTLISCIMLSYYIKKYKMYYLPER